MWIKCQINFNLYAHGGVTGADYVVGLDTGHSLLTQINQSTKYWKSLQKRIFKRDFDVIPRSVFFQDKNGFWFALDVKPGLEWPINIGY